MYIQSTFIHIKGIGAKTEQYLWKKNILTWDDYVNTIEKKNLFFSQNESLLNASYIAYKERNIDYFAEKLNDNKLGLFNLSSHKGAVSYDENYVLER